MSQLQQHRNDPDKLRHFATKNQYCEVRRTAVEYLIEDHLTGNASKDDYLLKEIARKNYGCMAELTALFKVVDLPAPESELIRFSYNKRMPRAEWDLSPISLPQYKKEIAGYLFTKIAPNEMFNIALLSTSYDIKTRAIRHVSIERLQQFIKNDNIHPYIATIYQDQMTRIKESTDTNEINRVRERLLQAEFKSEIFYLIGYTLKHYKTIPNHETNPESMTLQQLQRIIMEQHPNAEARKHYIQQCWDVGYLKSLMDNQNKEIIKDAVKLLQSYKTHTR